MNNSFKISGDYQNRLDSRALIKGNILKTVGLEPIIFIALLILIVLSCFVVYSAAGDEISIFQRHLRNIAIGLVIMVLFSRFPVTIFNEIATAMYFIAIALLLVVELFGLTINGSKRWLSLYFFNFQPTEFAKFSISIFICSYIVKQDIPLSLPVAAKSFLFILIPAFLIGRQPDLGSAIILFMGSFVAIFLAGISWRILLSFFIMLLASLPVAWLWVLKPYQKQRVLTLINPEDDILGSGWNIVQSQTAIGSGGLSGKGWLQGTQSHLEFLPEGHTDFIISVYSEEFGFIGLLSIVLIYSIIFFRSLWICKMASNNFNKLLAGVIAMIFFFAFFVNSAMVSGILPIVGIPLPLVSYGGTSTVTFLFSFGILMSIWRESIDNN